MEGESNVFTCLRALVCGGGMPQGWGEDSMSKLEDNLWS